MHHSKKSLNIDVWLRAVVEEVYNNKNSTEDKIPRNDYTMLLCANQVRPSLKFIGERIVADEARKTISLQAIQLPTLTDVSNRVLEVHSHHLQRERDTERGSKCGSHDNSNDYERKIIVQPQYVAAAASGADKRPWGQTILYPGSLCPRWSSVHIYISTKRATI